MEEHHSRWNNIRRSKSAFRPRRKLRENALLFPESDVDFPLAVIGEFITVWIDAATRRDHRQLPPTRLDVISRIHCDDDRTVRCFNSPSRRSKLSASDTQG